MSLKLLCVIVTFQVCTVMCCKFPTFSNTSALMSVKKTQAQVIRVNGCIKPSTETQGVTNITISNTFVPVLFKESVSNLSELQILTIQKTQLSRVEEDALLNLPQLKYLNLGNNELTTIKTATFKDLPLSNLYLDYNRIDTIENFAFQIFGIKLLDLSNNQLKSIEPEWFGYSSLQYLILDSNSITYIQADAFRSLRNLLTLSLRNNLIYGIHKDAFKGGLKLATVSLSHNRLFSLETETFAAIGSSLSYFYIDKNNLTYLPEHFLDKLTGLKVMALEVNPWQCPCYHKLRRITQERKIYVLPLVDPKGLYPVCIQSLNNSEVCVEAVDEEIIREYSKNIKG